MNIKANCSSLPEKLKSKISEFTGNSSCASIPPAEKADERGSQQCVGKDRKTKYYCLKAYKLFF